MIYRIRERVGDAQSGAALVWVAGSMVALLAMTALAVDLGWYYLNSGRLQRAADAAALAGVVNLPTYPAKADADGQGAATANAFGSATYTGSVLSDNTYQVKLAVEVPTFFATVVGIDRLPLSRTATAEYIPPVVMGSPASCFGVGDASIVSALPAAAKAGCAPYSLNHWAAINLPYTPKESGDPYSVVCDKMSAPNCTSSNGEYRPTGYWYGVDGGSAGGSLNVYVYDANYYARSNVDEGTGDYPFSPTPAPAAGGFITYQLYAPDTTPRDPTDNVPIPGCRLHLAAEVDPATYKDRWASLCTVPNAGGVYVLNVRTSGVGGGSNHYALAASASAGSARMYAIRDMSAYTNRSSGVARVYLAEVSEAYAGRELHLRFFDPGESTAAQSEMTVRAPDGSIPKCSWKATDPGGTVVKSSPNGPCKIVTTLARRSLYNQHWIDVVIDVPDASSYTCGSACFWTMDLELDNAHDRTTWSAWSNGNPVRLVPNP